MSRAGFGLSYHCLQGRSCDLGPSLVENGRSLRLTGMGQAMQLVLPWQHDVSRVSPESIGPIPCNTSQSVTRPTQQV